MTWFWGMSSFMVGMVLMEAEEALSPTGHELLFNMTVSACHSGNDWYICDGTTIESILDQVSKLIIALHPSEGLLDHTGNS